MRHVSLQQHDGVVTPPDCFRIPLSRGQQHEGIEHFFVEARRLPERLVARFDGLGEARAKSRIVFHVA